VANRRSELTRYENVDRSYLERRRLKPRAGWVLLWALGVGAVISGDFLGWNYGLAHAGFNGLAIATVLMAAMYVCMVFTIAELSAALPHAGGFFSFTRNALGPLGGFLCGLTDTIEYVVTPAVIVVGIGSYLNAVIFTDPSQAPEWLPLVWWILAYTIFVVINVLGVELTLKFGLLVTALAATVLIVFYVATLATGSFDTDLLYNIPPDAGQSATGLPHGWAGVFSALPFAIWFYLAIEQLPLAAEESHDVVRDMPRALLLGIGTLLILSLLTGRFQTPWVALVLGAVIGLALATAIHFSPKATGTSDHTANAVTVGAVLLNMAVFGAVLSYILVMVSYIVLKFTRPNMPRPYRSPLGIPGAAVGTVLAVVALAATFSVPEFRPGMYGVALFLVVGLAWFLCYSRHHLVAQAPEEEVALLSAARQELAGSEIETNSSPDSST
jgi:ethanolamine permease